MIGIPDTAFDQSTSAVETINDACLCPFPKQALDEVFTKSPTFYDLVVPHEVVASMYRRLQSVSRKDPAAERIISDAIWLLKAFGRGYDAVTGIGRKYGLIF